MFRELGSVTLKNGDRVEAGVVVGPDQDWADRVEGLLSHKGEIWRWGNEMCLRHDIGIDVLYYILHRDGEPFANMMNIEYRGVGLYGHVYTVPDDRRQGAASALMPMLMDDFRNRGGKALFLGTGYDSHPYHLYADNGFVGLEPKSGLMAYYTESEEAFYSGYFSDAATDISRLGWAHWPASIPLFAGNFSGAIRSTVMRLTGRSSTEGPMISLERDERQRLEKGQGPRSVALSVPETGAVVGMATTGPHPLWRGSWTIDIYCHPEHWGRGGELLSTVETPPAERLLAYCDAGFHEKEEVLSKAGFSPIATYSNRAAVDYARTRFVDVKEWEKAV